MPSARELLEALVLRMDTIDQGVASLKLQPPRVPAEQVGKPRRGDPDASGTLLAKPDIESAFCLLPVHPQDIHLPVAGCRLTRLQTPPTGASEESVCRSHGSMGADPGAMNPDFRVPETVKVDNRLHEEEEEEIDDATEENRRIEEQRDAGGQRGEGRAGNSDIPTKKTGPVKKDNREETRTHCHVPGGAWLNKEDGDREAGSRKRKVKFSKKDMELLTEECVDQFFGKASFSVPESQKTKVRNSILEKVNILLQNACDIG
ncbi:hypothetical protein NDU88_004530 [Pleurodeles waltl]|uniref:Centromere protein U n=1 Tax=Pleurodeles waltl TaxID=8319 RepID=A0AAV7UFJ6_PLEWA|nr:hypothetical protein NDU88_004530 [Pleurodeles waltl]